MKSLIIKDMAKPIAPISRMPRPEAWAITLNSWEVGFRMTVQTLEHLIKNSFAFKKTEKTIFLCLFNKAKSFFYSMNSIPSSSEISFLFLSALPSPGPRIWEDFTPVTMSITFSVFSMSSLI